MKATLLFVILFIYSNITCYSYISIITKKIASSSSLIRLNNDVTPSSSIADEIIGWDDDHRNLFIERYWQKRPVLIRNAFGNLEQLLQFDFPRDLFDLACDDDVESRMIIQKKNNKWNKEYGPFDKEYLDSYLNKSNWTILVQEVDRHIPRIADIWHKYFNVVPLWRRDDIMISYAAPGGGIGAHVDNYDVFLIQGKGRREWAIENSFVSGEEEAIREVPNVDTRLLRDFKADQKWVLETGDMLYLPPRIPHRGVSLGDDCVTISLGFRAPSYRSIMTAFCQHVCEKTIPEKAFYSDPDLQIQQSQALISDTSRKTISNTISKYVNTVIDDKEAFDKWLGTYLTVPLRMQLRQPQPFFLESYIQKMENKKENSENTNSDNIDNDNNDDYDNYDDDDDDDILPYSVRSKHSVATKKVFKDVEEILVAVLDGNVSLRRLEGTRIAHISSDSKKASFFIDGEEYPLPSDAAFAGPLLSDNRVLTSDLLKNYLNRNKQSSFTRVLASLLRSGIFYPVDCN